MGDGVSRPRGGRDISHPHFAVFDPLGVGLLDGCYYLGSALIG
jgi:hypothetical protein